MLFRSARIMIMNVVVYVKGVVVVVVAVVAGEFKFSFLVRSLRHVGSVVSMDARFSEPQMVARI